MFRPSQNLLFKSLPALNKLQIHHPLPLSQRESKQLLEVLKTSFRRHLDTQHPFQAQDASPSPPQSAGQPRRRRSNSDDGAHPADRHLHSVLTNPLFLAPEPPRFKAFRDPMDVFAKAVANGMMNISYAHGCLIRVKRNLHTLSSTAIREGMKESGAGLEVVKWLVSSGIANDTEFLRNESFGLLLMDFMVAEGLQEVALSWVQKAVHNRAEVSSRVRSKAHEDIVRPLTLLLRSELKGCNYSLDSAYSYLSRAAEMFKDLPRTQQRVLLRVPGSLLFSRTLYGNHQTPSMASFDSFVRLVPTFSTQVDRSIAHLDLHHPTSPSSDSALAYLKKQSTILETKPMLGSWSYVPGNKEVQRHILLGLDTAKFLLEKNRSSDAEWVMEFLRSNFPKEFGIKTGVYPDYNNERIEMADAEVLSLKLLGGLSLA